MTAWRRVATSAQTAIIALRLIPPGTNRRPPKEDRLYCPAVNVTVVDLTATDAEPDDAEMLAVLRLQTREMDDEAMATLDRELIRLALANPHTLARVAADSLSGSDPLLRVAAAYALGRAAEAAKPDLVAQIRATLVDQAAIAHDEALVDAMATALLHVWGRSDDETFATERRHATNPSCTLRLAAAKSLALSTPEPLPAFLVPIVRELSVDADPAVRSWAEHALSYVQE